MNTVMIVVKVAVIEVVKKMLMKKLKIFKCSECKSNTAFKFSPKISPLGTYSEIK